jgi:hypothetical protein
MARRHSIDAMSDALRRLGQAAARLDDRTAEIVALHFAIDRELESFLAARFPNPTYLEALSGYAPRAHVATALWHGGSVDLLHGFIQRWRDYAVTGHGGNVALKSRDPSDYQVSILQTVGSAADERAILSLETLWKDKLQSREMGLNRN